MSVEVVLFSSERMSINSLAREVTTHQLYLQREQTHPQRALLAQEPTARLAAEPLPHPGCATPEALNSPLYTQVTPRHFPYSVLVANSDEATQVRAVRFQGTKGVGFFKLLIHSLFAMNNLLEMFSQFTSAQLTNC